MSIQISPEQQERARAKLGRRLKPGWPAEWQIIRAFPVTKKMRNRGTPHTLIGIKFGSKTGKQKGVPAILTVNIASS